VSAVVRDVNQLHAVLAAYSGHLRHGSAWRAWCDLWRRYGWLRGVPRRDGWRLEGRWNSLPRDGARPFRQVYRRLVRGAGEDTLVFVKLGRYVEIYGPRRVSAVRLLGLRVAVLPRFGVVGRFGFNCSVILSRRRRISA
jgi:hypothetical protein